MSLIITAAIVGGGALIAGVTARVVASRRARERLAKTASAVLPPSPLAEAGFEVQQGDVISISARELWLEQGWLLHEAGEPIAAILFAGESVVLALPKPRSRLYLLDETSLSLPAEPPSSLDCQGARYERARRLPVEIEPLDKSVDPPWQSALLVEYRGLVSDVVWVLVHQGQCRAWRGRAVEQGEIEHWGGGAATLER